MVNSYHYDCQDGHTDTRAQPGAHWLAEDQDMRGEEGITTHMLASLVRIHAGRDCYPSSKWVGSHPHGGLLLSACGCVRLARELGRHVRQAHGRVTEHRRQPPPRLARRQRRRLHMQSGSLESLELTRRKALQGMHCGHIARRLGCEAPPPSAPASRSAHCQRNASN